MTINDLIRMYLDWFCGTDKFSYDDFETACFHAGMGDSDIEEIKKIAKDYLKH